MYNEKNSRKTIFHVILLITGLCLLAIYGLRFSMKRCDCDGQDKVNSGKVHVRKNQKLIGHLLSVKESDKENEAFDEIRSVPVSNQTSNQDFLDKKDINDDLEPLHDNIKVLLSNQILNEDSIQLELFLDIPWNAQHKIDETFNEDLAIIIEDFWDWELEVSIEVAVEKIENFNDGIVLKLTVEYDERNVNLLEDNFNGQEELFKRISKHFSTLK